MANEYSYEKKSVYKKASPEIIERAFEYAEDYKKFIDASKTERESVKNAIELAKK